jgi:diadenosine tetraphosphatase ApaH/serine/threonine PP2A family protein phosphatase
MPTSIRSRRLRRSLTVLLLASGALLATVGQAAASVDTARTDRPEIEAGNLDFGNKDLLGFLNGGIVNYDVVGSTITPWVSGILYINNAKDTCTRIEVVYHDAAHDELDRWDSNGYCVSDNKSYDEVISDSAFGSADFDHVIIELQTRKKSDPVSSYHSVGSAVEYYAISK